MKALLTGAFGNIGESTLLALFEKNYDIRCFDLKIGRNEEIQKKLTKKGQFETIWGDILNQTIVETTVEDIDCIIHLAGIIPPLSETKPDLAKSVNRTFETDAKRRFLGNRNLRKIIRSRISGTNKKP